MKKSILSFLTFLIFSLVSINAQVTEVNYQVEFNEFTGLYDCSLVIVEGSATDYPDRVQFSSQFSIVVPTGSEVSIAENFNPLIDNITYDGTQPTEWILGAMVISPTEEPDYDFYSIVPVISPICAYNDLSPGDVIKLFSIFMGEECPLEIQIFDSSIFPPVLNFADFSNGFTLGGVDQLYTGNTGDGTANSFSVSLENHEICKDDCVELYPNTYCAELAITYAWFANGVLISNEYELSVCPEITTTYSFVVTRIDGIELTAESVITVTIPPEAINTGSDILCVGETTAVLPITDGTWEVSDNSILLVSEMGLVTALNPGTATLTFYANDQECYSTTPPITVQPIPDVAIIGADSICIDGFTTLYPATGGDWQSDNNNVATVSNNGTVTGVGAGVARFTFTDVSTGCPSNPTEKIFIAPIFTITNSGSDTLDVNEITSLSTGYSGTWLSTTPNIATVNSSTGIVTAHSPGNAIIIFTPEIFECLSQYSLLVTDSDPCDNLNSQDTIITGTAFIDNNADGYYNFGDQPLRNVLVTITPGNFSILTDDQGKYTIPTLSGFYVLTANVNDGDWEQDELAIDNITISEPCNLDYNFAFVPLGTVVPQANISITNTNPRCDWETRFFITIENTGSEPIDGILTFDFDDETSFFASTIVDYQVIGKSVTANTQVLEPFVPVTYRITLKMPSGSTSLPLMDFKATLTDMAGVIINEYDYQQQLKCSYDPNDKRAYPDRTGDDNLTLMSENIEYTIRFQNNGNDTAYTVKIIDKLDTNIDPSSIRVVNSSHSVVTCIEEDVVVFLFGDIDLVDSMTNYDGSQGFVTFRCDSKGGRAEFTPVNNHADIIFDTNEPIVTNQTLNTLVSKLCEEKSTTMEANICMGDSYEGYTESGTYTQSYELPFGCDSVVTIILDVQGITYSYQTFEVCEGSSININGNNYIATSSETIMDTIVNDLGCLTNVFTFDISVRSALETTIDTTICAGDSYQGYSESGTYTLDLSSNFGCDSTVTISLDVQSVENSTISGSICQGESIMINGTSYELETSTTIMDTLVNNLGCISDINTYEIDVTPTLSINMDTIICEGFSYQGYSETGVYSVDSIDLETGCPITLTINLTVLPASDSNCIVATDNIDLANIKIYPNPTSETFTIDADFAIDKVTVFNTAMAQITQIVNHTNSTKMNIQTEHWATGLYIIVIDSGERKVYRKVVVE